MLDVILNSYILVIGFTFWSSDTLNSYILVIGFTFWSSDTSLAHSKMLT